MNTSDEQVTKSTPCGCGRSPTGQCIGWHNLTEDQYWDALRKYTHDSIPSRMAGIDERYG